MKNLFNDLENLCYEKSVNNLENLLLTEISELIDGYCNNEELKNFLISNIENDENYCVGSFLSKESYIYLFNKYRLHENKSFVRVLCNEYNYRINLTNTTLEDFKIIDCLEYVLNIIKEYILNI